MGYLGSCQRNEVSILSDQDTALLTGDAQEFNISDLAARDCGSFGRQHVYATKSELRSNRPMDMLVKEVPQHAIGPLRLWACP